MKDSVKLLSRFSCWLIGKLNVLFLLSFQTCLTSVTIDFNQLLVCKLSVVPQWTDCKREASFLLLCNSKVSNGLGEKWKNIGGDLHWCKGVNYTINRC